MARIRKTDSTKLTGKQHTVWHIAVYIRLSKDDGNDESMSVTNQRKIILEYIEENFAGEEYIIIDFYIDDGRSGTTEDTRPEFQRMVRDIEAGKVNCVIGKTLSRCFRNYSDQGRFLEQFIPAHRCRFIAISNPHVDTYDDPDCTQGMEIPINGLMNDRYAAKTSVDVRRTFDTKRRRGEFIGAFAPYGYQKAPEDKNALIIDPDAASVVEDIFHWFVRDGMSKAGIAKRLNAVGIPNPTAYKHSKGLAYQCSHPNNDGLWSPRTVSGILKNAMYIGTMVQGRYSIISYKVHKQILTDPSKWFMVDGTHEAIVDKETFEAAQGLLKRDTRAAPGKNNVYLFSGLLRCGDCGKAMVRTTSRGIVYYACRTYREKGKDYCSRHTIRGDVLEKAVLVALQKQIELVTSMVALVEEINSAPIVRTQSTRLNALLKQKSQELDKATTLLDGLYIDMKAGEISLDQYHRMKERTQEQVNRLQDEVTHIQKEQGIMAQGVQQSDPYLTAFLKHRNIQTLERGLLVELVKYIYIHADGSIHIEFNFADQYQRIADFIEDNQKELYVVKSESAC